MSLILQLASLLGMCSCHQGREKKGALIHLVGGVSWKQIDLLIDSSMLSGLYLISAEEYLGRNIRDSNAQVDVYISLIISGVALMYHCHRGAGFEIFRQHWCTCARRADHEAVTKSA